MEVNTFYYNLGTSLHMDPHLSTAWNAVLYGSQYILLLSRNRPTFYGSPPVDSMEHCPIWNVETFCHNLGTSLHMDPNLSTAWNAVLSGTSIHFIII